MAIAVESSMTSLSRKLGTRIVCGVICAIGVLLPALKVCAKTDQLGIEPTYWIDLNGSQAQYGAETLTARYGAGFRPKEYEPITYWGRSGCWNFEQAENINFKCGNGDFSLFVVARGGCNYTDKGAVVFCLGPKTPSEANGKEAIDLVIKNSLSDNGFGDEKSEAIVRTWDAARTTPREIVRVTVPGCYAAFRYVPYAVVYDSSSKVVTLYANGVPLGSSASGAFPGFSAETCWWQVASVRGGRPDSNVIQNDSVGITDFRYYKTRLSGEHIAAISSEYPLADQTGEMPYYHYAFNGSRSFDSSSNLSQTLGAARVRNTTGKGYRGSNGRDYFYGYSCETLRDGFCAAVNIPPAYTGHGDYWPVTNSFTLSMSARLDGSRNTLLFALGSATEVGAKHGSLAIVSRDVGVVWFGPWSADAKWNESDGVTVRLGCVDATHYHNFTIAYDREAGEASFYVDGISYGSINHAGFTNSEEDDVRGRWGFVRPSDGIVDGLSDGSGHAVEEFRFYTKALNSAQIIALAEACPHWRDFSDSTGRIPHIRYSFNGQVQSSGHQLLNKNGGAINGASFDVKKYSSIREGSSQAARIGNSNYGSGLQTNRPFTVFMSARAGRFDMNGVLFSIGTKDGGGIALVYKDSNTIGLYKWPSAGYICSAPIEGGVFAAYHAYAFTIDPEVGTASLYVDGNLVSEGVCGDNPIGDGHWQFTSVYGGVPNGLAANGYVDVENFRVYVPALSADEVKGLSGDYPPWRELPSSGVLPEYWYTFDADGGVPKGTNFLRTAQAISQLPPGDSIVRDGTFACTNVYRHLYTYGPAGSISVGEKFSIFVSARIKTSSDGKSGVLLGLGSPVNNDSETLAFACETTNAVSLYSWPNGVKTLLVTAPVSGMDESFNSYTVTWDGETLRLYINGTMAAEKKTGSDFAGFSSGPEWQLGGSGMYGGSAPGTEGAVYTLEDFRLYSVCLTPEQVMASASDLPRWPLGWIWEGGDSGSWQDSVWKGWDWTAGACGDWVTGRVLPSGANAHFTASEKTLQLSCAASPVAGHVQMDRSVELAGHSLKCSSLSVADGVSFRPANVGGLLSPGVILATLPPFELDGVDFSSVDEHGNRYYFTSTNRLRYGDGSVPALKIIIR